MTVYASADHTKRGDLWNNLHHVNITMNQHWLVIWDFNEISDPCDKKGGALFN